MNDRDFDLMLDEYQAGLAEAAAEAAGAELRSRCADSDAPRIRPNSDLTRRRSDAGA